MSTWSSYGAAHLTPRQAAQSDGIPDDSVRTERWTLGFEEAAGGVYALTGALRELRCHEGRGHQGFAGEVCL